MNLGFKIRPVHRLFLDAIEQYKKANNGTPPKAIVVSPVIFDKLVHTLQRYALAGDKQAHQLAINLATSSTPTSTNFAGTRIVIREGQHDPVLIDKIGAETPV